MRVSRPRIVAWVTGCSAALIDRLFSGRPAAARLESDVLFLEGLGWRDEIDRFGDGLAEPLLSKANEERDRVEDDCLRSGELGHCPSCLEEPEDDEGADQATDGTE